MSAQLKHSLNFAIAEIEQYRRRLEILEARDQVVRLFTNIIMPPTPQGYGEDVVYRLREELRRLEAPQDTQSSS